MMKIYQKIFSATFPVIVKDMTKADGARYEYATFDNMQEAIEPELKKAKLLLTHRCDGMNVVTSVVDTES